LWGENTQNTNQNQTKKEGHARILKLLRGKQYDQSNYIQDVFRLK